MFGNNTATTTSSNHPQDRDHEQRTKIGEQKNKIVQDDEITVDDSLQMGYSAAGDSTAPPEQQHQQNESIIPQEKTKMNKDQQKQLAESLEEIRKSRAPLSASEQFDLFNHAEASGVASRVAPYYWRPVPPALRKPHGMDRYNVRPAWNSPPPSPSTGRKEDGELWKGH